jgi:hypothetical protein
MRPIMLSLAVITALAPPAMAQMSDLAGFEVRSFVGAYVPLGSQRNDFKTATMFGAQFAHEIADRLHILGSLGWTHGHNKFANLNDDRTFIWQYDMGAELNSVTHLENQWLFRPLIGAGFGARTYRYLAAGLATTTCAAAYGTVGSEFQRGTVAVRVDARGYVNCYKSPMKSVSEDRNDMALTLGVVYHMR